MSSPSALLKVNYLVMRYLHFGSVLGELQEGYFFASRCHLSRCSSTKMPFLCSKSPKMRVSNPKSAQKPRFCARNARKQGFQTPKAHKNLDFVLEKPENEGFKAPKSTKTSILCSGRLTRGLGCSSRPTQRASGSGEVAVGHQNEASGRRKRAASHQKEASGRANAHKFVYF